MSDTDRIVKSIQLRAPRSRVWAAISDAREFGAWFGVSLDGDFAPGRAVSGTLQYKGEPFRLELHVEAVEPERRFAFRWHPFAVDPSVDYSAEPMTLVEFSLEDSPEGTRLTVMESGFDQVPASRRARAFEMNSEGWGAQIERVAKHVASGDRAR